MAALEKSSLFDLVKKCLESSTPALNEDLDILFSENRGRDFIISTLGEERAKQLLGQVVEVGAQNTLESLELVDTRTLAATFN